MEKGYLSLILHAHLPYVRHPEHEFFFEERWLFEAISDTYIPLINAYDGLLNDGVPFRITMTMSPTLCEMLADPLLEDRYLRHINQLIELSEKEVERTRWQPDLAPLANLYLERFRNCRYVFQEKYGKNLVTAFRKFQDAGVLEIITCGATHGFLPNLHINPRATRAQIKVAANNYRKHFGRGPRGIWLPECGYTPGVDAFLAEENIRFFMVDTHGVLFASPRPKYGVFAPILTKSGVAAFGRDMESSKAVWSAEEGYPGDYRYREYYRDIGWDLEYDYVRPYIDPAGNRINTGIKYYKITGKSKSKEPYNRRDALEAAASHASNFMFNREKQIDHLSKLMDRKPLVVSPYDAELYGHWWFEGVEWLDYLIRKLAYDQNTVKLTTPIEYLEMYPRNQVATPSFSSWGYKGYAEVWLEGSNDWIYRHLHMAADRMCEMANRFPNANGLFERALNQMARELLLVQASDWAFIMKTGTVVGYAVRRTKEHISNFTRLYEGLQSNYVDEGFLCSVEGKDNVFQEINYRVYAG